MAVLPETCLQGWPRASGNSARKQSAGLASALLSAGGSLCLDCLDARVQAGPVFLSEWGRTFALVRGRGVLLVALMGAEVAPDSACVLSLTDWSCVPPAPL